VSARKKTVGAKPRAKAKPASTHPVRKLSAADARLVERVRRICMKLPEANERISHGEPTWFAGKGKVFAMYDDHHHGAPHVSVWLPAPPGLQEALIERDPGRFWRPPYLGHRGWIAVVLDRRPDWGVVAGLVEQGFRLVASARLVARLPARETE
jgi:predicted DNA-binding protein (MmcQ/YjbR family)